MRENKETVSQNVAAELIEWNILESTHILAQYLCSLVLLNHTHRIRALKNQNLPTLGPPATPLNFPTRNFGFG